MAETTLTVADLEANYGEQVTEIRNTAIQEERARIGALDALDDGSEQVHKIIMHAKENGQTADDVRFFIDTAKEAVPADKMNDMDKGQAFMKKVIDDNMNSGVNDVKGGAVTTGAEDSAEWASFLDMLNKQAGGKR